jgi:hypothetical protein
MENLQASKSRQEINLSGTFVSLSCEPGKYAKGKWLNGKIFCSQEYCLIALNLAEVFTKAKE